MTLFNAYVCTGTVVVPVPVQEPMVTENPQPIVVDTSEADPKTDQETNASPVDLTEVDPAIDQVPVALPQEEPQEYVRKLNNSYGIVCFD